MVRTLDAALELIRVRGLVTEVPATHHVPSLAEAVIGGVATGSVWHHAKGNLIFRLGKALRASPEVLALRLWDGKMTFVDRRLWPEVFRVVMEPMRRRAALQGLSDDARQLLERVEREGEVRLPRHEQAKARETLEARLLVQASDVQVDGQFWARLQSWRRWASSSVSAGVAEFAESLSYAEALQALASPSGSAPVGPWMAAP